LTTREYYEEYWVRESTSVISDPLTETRISLLRHQLNGAKERVLDVGSGPGTLVGCLDRAGHDAIGFDISQRAVDVAHARFPSAKFLRHSAEELPWPVEPESQDLVVAFEVIEHLLRPRALIEGAWRVLKVGGHLALSTPYHGRLKNVAVALAALDHHFAPEGDHIRFFTDCALRRLLESNGFEVERIRHFGRFGPLWAGVFVWARKR
jgi:2-polyprenyl-3-methyl-5-hydroxy-6-metoxy-1,4-benzoquinol methylase